MSVIIIKTIAQESHCNVGSNSTFSNSALVRVVNIGSERALVATSNASGVIGSFTMLANSEVIVQKNYTDVLYANTENVYGTPIAFTNQ
jgi:hypothetical protein